MFVLSLSTLPFAAAALIMYNSAVFSLIVGASVFILLTIKNIHLGFEPKTPMF
jgi:hypothetical protein